MPTKFITQYAWLVETLRTLNTDECVLWPFRLFKSGYGQVHVTGRKHTQCTAHRIAYELTHGPIPEGMCVCHHCDIRACINTRHFFLGDNADNATDAGNKGRLPYGEAHWNAKLTREQVVGIREAYKPRVITMRTLAAQYGVTSGHICHILQGKNRVRDH